MWRKLIRHEILHLHGQEKLMSISPSSSNYMNSSKLYYNTKLNNWWSYVDIVTHIFGVNIFNICIRCLCLNATYIIPNAYCTKMYYDQAIVPTPCYHKWCLICHLIFVFSVISKHYSISDFIVSVKSFTMFVDVIFLNFCLLLLTY